MSATLSPNLRRALARVSHTWETAAALHLSERTLWALERRALVEALPGEIRDDGPWLWRLLRPADPRPDQPPRSTEP